MVDDEIRRIALGAVSGADLHAGSVRRSKKRKEVEEDAIFFKLGECAKSDLVEPREGLWRGSG